MMIAAIVLLLLAPIAWVIGDLVEAPAVVQISTSVVLAFAGVVLAALWLGRRKKKEPTVGEDPAIIGAKKRLSARLSQARAAMAASRSAKAGSTLHSSPAYLVIGPPGSGKTSIVRRSGLAFPFRLRPEGADDEGPTPDCDWWFADHALFIDTTGRYVVRATKTDEAEFRELLAGLKKAGLGRRTEGLIVCLSVAELLASDPSQLEQSLDRVKACRDDVFEILERNVPIYVLLTKADLLPGLCEFAESIEKSMRREPLGFALPWPLPSAGKPLARAVEQRLEQLVGALEGLVLSRGGITTDTTHGPRPFELVLQAGELGSGMLEVASRLSMPDLRGEPATVRGLYLSSSEQHGRPIDRWQAKLEGRYGVRLPPSPDVAEPGRRGLFAKVLLSDVLAGDVGLAKDTARGRTRRLRMELGALGAGALVSALTLFAGVSSYRANRDLIEESIEDLQSLRRNRSMTAEGVSDRFAALERVAARTSELRRFRREGPPVHLRFGFYAGDELYDGLRSAFVRGMAELFVEPVDIELSAAFQQITLDGASDNPAHDFEVFRAYRMVTEPPRLIPEEAAGPLTEIWKRRLPAALQDADPRLRKLATIYLELVRDGAASWAPPSHELSASMRNILRTQHADVRSLTDGIDSEGSGLRLRDLIGDRGDVRLVSRASVPRRYTSAGYSIVRDRLKKGPDALASWVLHDDVSPMEGVAALEESYKSAFAQAWIDFIAGLELESTPTAAMLLDSLTKKPFAFEALLRGILEHAQFPSEANDILEDASKLKGLLSKKKDKPKSSEWKVPVAVPKELESLKILVREPKSSGDAKVPSPITQYHDELLKLRAILQEKENVGPEAFEQALVSARSVTRKILEPVSESLRPALDRLLMGPLVLTKEKSAHERAKSLFEAFQREVCDLYLGTLDGRYPFSRQSKDDAVLDDVVSVLGPDGKAFTFLRDNLSPYLIEAADGYSEKPGVDVSPEIVAFYSQAALASRALFGEGQSEVRFSFSVKPRSDIVYQQKDYRVSGVTLEIGDARKSYAFGEPVAWSFVWPTEKRSAALSVDGDGDLPPPLSESGDWAVLRLIDRAFKKPSDGRAVEVTFRLGHGELEIPVVIEPRGRHSPLFDRWKLRCTGTKSE